MEESILEIQRLISQNKYDDAAELASSHLEKKEVKDDDKLTGIFNEQLARIYSLKGQPGVAVQYARNVMIYRANTKANFHFCESVPHIADCFVSIREYQLAVGMYEDGMKLAEETDNQEFVRIFAQKIEELKKVIQEIENFEKEQFGEEATPSKSKEKKQASHKQTKASISQVKVTKRPKEKQKKTSECSIEGELKEGELKERFSKDEVIKKESGAVMSLPDKFVASITISLESCSKSGNYKGTTKDFLSLPKSFIQTNQFEVNNFTGLQSLCSSHQSLLTVESVTTHDSTLFFITECVYDINEFFELELVSFRKNSSDMTWWDFISDQFRVIFRDVIKGLLFLFSCNRASGNVPFGLFVTMGGRGRLLPSMRNANAKFDVKELVQRMLDIICFSLPEQSEQSDVQHLGLPLELENLLLSLPNFVGYIPPPFLLDHPFFWTKEEKITFIYKMRRIDSMEKCGSALQFVLERDSIFVGWGTKLSGVYKSVWAKGDPHMSKIIPRDSLPKGVYVVKAYKLHIDIIRFFGAVYRHANQSEYSSDRNNQDLTEEDMEEDLSSIFPDFYTNIISSLCKCVLERRVDESWLKLIQVVSIE